MLTTCTCVLAPDRAGNRCASQTHAQACVGNATSRSTSSDRSSNHHFSLVHETADLQQQSAQLSTPLGGSALRAISMLRSAAKSVLCCVVVVLATSLVAEAALAPLYGTPWSGGRRRKLEQYGEADLPEGGAVIVMFDESVARSEQIALLEAMRLRTRDSNEPAFEVQVSSLFAELSGVAANLTATALQFVRNSPGVRFVEYDQPVILAATQAYVHGLWL